MTVTKGFSIGRALGDAFEVIRRYPAAVLVWGVIQVAPFLMVAPLFLEFMLSTFGTSMSGQEPTGAEMQAMMSRMIALQGVMMLANLGQLIATVVVITAVMRAVYQFGAPARRFFLGLGMDELRVGVTGLAVMVAAYFVLMVLAFIGMGVGVMLFAIDTALGAFGFFALVLAILVCMVVVMARGAMIPFATGWRGDFAFEEGWRAVSGRWARMTGLCFAVFLIVMAAQMVIMAVGMILVFAILIPSGALAGLAEGGAVAPPPRWVIWAWILGLFLPVSAVVGAISALTYAPFASAWRQLAEGDVEAVTKA